MVGRIGGKKLKGKLGGNPFAVCFSLVHDKKTREFPPPPRGKFGGRNDARGNGASTRP
jgi:hypothetical protein